MTNIKLPVKTLRSWEPYITPDADELAEYMAKPFTRIEDADGETVINAHDCFEFKPGHAERIVACLHACAGVEDPSVDLVPRAEYDAKERYWIEHANQIKRQRDALVKALKEIAEYDWQAWDGGRQYRHCGQIALAALAEVNS